MVPETTIIVANMLNIFLFIYIDLIFGQLKIKVKSEYNCSGSWVEIVVNSTIDLWIESIVLGDHQCVLHIGTQPEVGLVVEDLTNIVANIDIIHSQERSILNVVVRQIVV